MKRLTLLLLLCPVLAVASAAPWRVRPDGAGPLRIGMDFDEVNRILGGGLRRTQPGLRGSEDCDQLPVPDRPGMWLMFLGDRLARVDVAEPGVKSWRGIGVGDSIGQLRTAHPRAVESVHKYDDEERYYTELAPGARAGIRFETGKGRVGLFYAGKAEAIRLVEGCL
ncbi:MAG TPA: hypothetical protein VNT33_07480 [Telluria sp.]|nr:hypothetical protein [Telluria sp.]